MKIPVDYPRGKTWRVFLLRFIRSEVLAEEFLGPLGVTQFRLAKDKSVPARRINEIVKGSRSISADTAAREVLWDIGAFLAEPSVPIRSRGSARPAGHAVRCGIHVFQRGEAATASGQSTSVKAMRSGLLRKGNERISRGLSDSEGRP